MKPNRKSRGGKEDTAKSRLLFVTDKRRPYGGEGRGDLSRLLFKY